MIYWIWYSKLKINTFKKYILIKKFKNPEIIFKLRESELKKREFNAKRNT